MSTAPIKRIDDSRFGKMRITSLRHLTSYLGVLDRSLSATADDVSLDESERLWHPSSSCFIAPGTLRSNASQVWFSNIHVVSASGASRMAYKCG
jgi:hypothetical protein